MSDVLIQDAPNEGQTDEPKTTQPDINKLMETIEQLKSAQSGSDKKVNELLAELDKERKEKEELRKQTLSEEELFKLEKEEFERKKLEYEAQIKKEQIKAQAITLLTAKGFSAEVLDIIDGGINQENLISKIEALSNLIATRKEEVKKTEMDEYRANNTILPDGGGGEPPDRLHQLKKQYAEEKDLKRRISLNREIQNLEAKRNLRR